MLDGWRLIAIALDYPHHASGSGYGQLAKQIDYDAIVTPPTGIIAKKYDRWVRRAQKYKVIARLTRRRISTEVRYLLGQGLKGPKLVHVLYGEHHSWLLRGMRSKRNVRKVMTIHLPPALWHVSFKHGQLNRFDAIILMSHSQIEPLRKGLGYKGRVEVIEHGVDTDRFRFFDRPLPAGTLQCTMVGNFLRDYEALANLARMAADKKLDMHFHVVANKEAAAPIQGLPNVTHHLGISDIDLVELYGRCHIAVFTMQDCTANNALLEAMSTGLPVVANDVGGMRTYANDSFAALTSALDPELLIQAIHNVADPTMYLQRCSAARRKAEEFSWPQIRSRTLALYTEVIQNGV